MHRNLLKPAHSRQPLISGIPSSAAWILFTLLTVLIALPFGIPRSVPSRPVPSRPVPPKTGPPPARVVKVEARIAAEGLDSHHRSLPFTVYVLTQELSWKLNSSTDFEGGETLLSPELTAAINGASDVFCVGTASFEGPVRLEEARAAQRAAQLAAWLSAVIRNPGQTHVFTLNAGQYRGPPDLNSTYQRKAVLIIAGPHDQEVDLGEGLASGLKQQQAFPVVYSLLHYYSRSNAWLKVLKGKGGPTQGE